MKYINIIKDSANTYEIIYMDEHLVVRRFGGVFEHDISKYIRVRFDEEEIYGSRLCQNCYNNKRTRVENLTDEIVDKNECALCINKQRFKKYFPKTKNREQ